nr:hypothetical protein [Desulfuromonas versatilis]
MPLQVKVEYPINDGRFGEIDFQPLFVSSSSRNIHRDNSVAKRGIAAIEITLPSVLLHGSQGVLGVLLALVFVKKAKDLTSHFPGRVRACLLGDGDDLHPSLVQLSLVKAKLQRIPEKPGQAMYDNCFKGGGGGGRFSDHLLKDRPTIIQGRCSRLLVFGRNRVPLRLAPVMHLSQLVRD